MTLMEFNRLIRTALDGNATNELMEKLEPAFRGAVVRVKSAEEVRLWESAGDGSAAVIAPDGLYFSTHMYKYCGRSFKVSSLSRGLSGSHRFVCLEESEGVCTIPWTISLAMVDIIELPPTVDDGLAKSNELDDFLEDFCITKD